MKRALLLLALVVIGAVPARAQQAADIEACHNRNSTTEIELCLSRQLAIADRHLNVAYQKALKIFHDKAAQDLREAQRAWLTYRDKRCTAITPTEGTIGRIVYPDCMLTMTAHRADELDGDAKGLAE